MSLYARVFPGLSREQSPESPQERIAELERQIKQINSDKVFRWTNLKTGEVVLQDRVKQLKEPFEYDREVLRHPEDEAEITRLTEELKKIRTPAVEFDPIGINESLANGRALSLNVRVTRKDGYSFTYDEATLFNERIKTSRTMRSLKDSPRVPEQVMRQAIDYFFPPEWVELDLKFEAETGEGYLSGQIWRMHVTHTNLRIDSIHTPWSRPLRLERDVPALVFLREVEGQLVPAGEFVLRYDTIFVVEARYGSPQDGGTRELTLDWGGDPLVLHMERQGDGRVYRSERLFLMPPAEKGR